MRLLILGATGRTGGLLVEHALAQGHDVTVLVRDAGRLRTDREHVRVHVGGLNAPDVVAAAVQGQDAALVALGNRRPRELFGTDLMVSSVDSVVTAMKLAGVRRIVLLSALGAGESRENASRMLRLAFATLLRRIGRDKAASEELLRRSDLDWTVVYPPRLTDGPLTERYRYGPDLHVRGVPSVSRADVAHLMLAQLHDSNSRRRSIIVTSAS